MIQCERCKRYVHKAEVCSFCGRTVCYHCVKAIKNYYDVGKKRAVICKDCWTNMETRKRFKSL